MADVMPADLMCLRVAELRLWLDARGTGLHMAAPASHSEFLMPEPVEVSTGSGVLVLRVRNEPLPESVPGRTPLCLTDVWELWLDEDGRYVFVAPRQSPPRRIVVDSGFAAGEVQGPFSSSDSEGAYPLQGLGLRLCVNWLAGYGDIVLHAAGVAVGGKGYAFVGSAGVGKSTLAAALSLAPSVTVLGEDQVILRYLEDRFWIYGTPWHVDPAFCSPLGVPLEKLFFLERTGEHGVASCTPLDGIARLLQTAFVPYYRPAVVSAILERLALLAERVPFYTLSYRLGSDVLKLVGEA